MIAFAIWSGLIIFVLVIVLIEIKIWELEYRIKELERELGK